LQSVLQQQAHLLQSVRQEQAHVAAEQASTLGQSALYVALDSEATIFVEAQVLQQQAHLLQSVRQEQAHVAAEQASTLGQTVFYVALDSEATIFAGAHDAASNKSDAAFKKQLDEVIALLQVTDDKLQVALDNFERSEVRCSSLQGDLAQAKQELDSFQRAADAAQREAQTNIDSMQSTVALHRFCQDKFAGVQAELAAALQDAAANRAAFLASERSASASVSGAQERIMQEWAQRVAELEQVTSSPIADVIIHIEETDVFAAHGRCYCYGACGRFRENCSRGRFRGSARKNQNVGNDHFSQGRPVASNSSFGAANGGHTEILA